MSDLWLLGFRQKHPGAVVYAAGSAVQPLKSGTSKFLCAALIWGPALVICGAALAEDVPTIELTIKDHRFNPAEIHISAHTPTVLTIKNEDPIAEEFDSAALKVEKVIAGGGTGLVRLRPLETGSYPFIGEYHSETAQGVVIVE